MLPPGLNTSLGKDERRLLKLFSALSPENREQVTAYLEFLLSRQQQTVSAVDEPLAEPLSIPRPKTESVIGAIKRLSKTYSMVDKSLVLHETSDLMTAHVLKGRDAKDVIDELEALFRRHYENICNSLSEN